MHILGRRETRRGEVALPLYKGHGPLCKQRGLVSHGQRIPGMGTHGWCSWQALGWHRRAQLQGRAGSPFGQGVSEWPEASTHRPSVPRSPRRLVPGLSSTASGDGARAPVPGGARSIGGQLISGRREGTYGSHPPQGGVWRVPRRDAMWTNLTENGQSTVKPLLF